MFLSINTALASSVDIPLVSLKMGRGQQVVSIGEARGEEISDNEFENHRFRIQNAKFSSEVMRDLRDSEYLFIIDKFENIIAVNKHHEKAQHPFLSSYQDVIFAGELKFENGELVRLTNESLHYQASIKESLRAIELLSLWGIDQIETLKLLDYQSTDSAEKALLSKKLKDFTKNLEIVVPENSTRCSSL